MNPHSQSQGTNAREHVKMISIDKESPLSEGLQKASFPSQFRMAQVPKFKGDNDPRQFLMTYEATMNSSGGDEVATAKAFACALEGPALT